MLVALTELRVTDREQWARASHRIAPEVAYTSVENPRQPPTPSTGYVRTMHAIGRRQAALAAYRLSDMLTDGLG